MNLRHLYPEIEGDLTITPTSGAEGEGFALSRTDRNEPVLMAVAPDNASYGTGEAERHARLLARSPTMLRLLLEALAIFAEAFDAPDDEGCDISGADLIDLFAHWRHSVKVQLSAPITPRRQREGGCR